MQNQDDSFKRTAPVKETWNQPSCFEQLLELFWYVLIFYVIHSYGWILGLGGLLVLWQVIIKTLLYFFGLEHIGGFDKLTFCDDERGVTNIVAFMRLDRPENLDALKHQFISRKL